MHRLMSGLVALLAVLTIQSAIAAEFKNKLLAVDFLPVLAECSSSVDEAGMRVSRSATLEEQWLLNSLVSPSGARRELNSTVTAVAAFASRTGRLPENGVELFPELLTEAGYQQFIELTPVQRFDKYSAGINIATGKFFSTFVGEWTPGGISFEKAQQGERIIFKKRADGKPLLSTTSPQGYTELWSYRVFGMHEPKPIYTDWVGSMNDVSAID